MIRLIQSGDYSLIETKRHIKILQIGLSQYAWIEPMHIGEILVVSHNPHKTDCVLSIGAFRLYSVTDEPDYSDHIHLELETGMGQWQGYILLTGLPDNDKKRGRIIPTQEIITGNLELTSRIETALV